MENKQQNFSRSSNVKTCQGSELVRKSSDTHINKTRRRDHSNSSRNDTSSRNTRQSFNNTNNINNINSNSQKKNQSRYNNDKRPRPRGVGAASFGNNVDEGAAGGAGSAKDAIGDGGGGGYERQANLNGRNTNRNGVGGGGYNASSDEGYSGINPTSSGLANNSTNSAIARHGKKFDYELNSVYAAGSKKQNLNHLLNFHYSPRDYDMNFFGRGGNSSSGNNTMQRNHNNSRSKQHKYNKEQYLQANFQFVINSNVKPKFDGSPDTLIDWTYIEQVNIQTTEEPQCPICLYPPMAAKITRCGHVYCWPCILHYLSLSDKTWRRCPICFDSIYGQDLKSCIILQQHHVAVGEEITFRLMRRRKGSLFIEPFENQTAFGSEYYPIMANADPLQRFSKFLIAKRDDIQHIIERERKELLFDSGNDVDLELEGDESYAEFVFVQQALTACHERMKLHGLLGNMPSPSKHIKKAIASSPTPSDETPLPDKEADEEKEKEKQKNEDTVQLETVVEDVLEVEPNQEDNATLSIIDEDEIVEAVNTTSATTNEQQPTASVNEDIENNEAQAQAEAGGSPSTPTKTEKFHYFYQSDDGQNIYLHPLNIKMLQACYGSLDLAPTSITANVVQREQFPIDEEQRRRLTCLGHLPLTCECSFVEVDLKPPIVTPTILKEFKEDIMYRKKLRQRREQEEIKRERKINEFNDRQMGKLISSTANLNITSPQEFPSCGFEERLPPILNIKDEPTPSTSKRAAQQTSASRQKVTSYSNVAESGEKPSSKQEHWPAMSAPRSSANYQELSTAWRRPEGGAAKTNKNNAASVAAAAGLSAAYDSDTYVEELELRPMSTNFGDVLAEAMSQKRKRNSTVSGSSNDDVRPSTSAQAAAAAAAAAAGGSGGSGNSNASHTVGPSGSRKRKQRSKNVPIFATGMNFKGKD